MKEHFSMLVRLCSIASIFVKIKASTGKVLVPSLQLDLLQKLNQISSYDSGANKKRHKKE